MIAAAALFGYSLCCLGCGNDGSSQKESLPKQNEEAIALSHYLNSQATIKNVKLFPVDGKDSTYQGEGQMGDHEFTFTVKINGDNVSWRTNKIEFEQVEKDGAKSKSTLGPMRGQGKWEPEKFKD